MPRSIAAGVCLLMMLPVLSAAAASPRTPLVQKEPAPEEVAPPPGGRAEPRPAPGTIPAPAPPTPDGAIETAPEDGSAEIPPDETADLLPETFIIGTWRIDGLMETPEHGTVEADLTIVYRDDRTLSSSGEIAAFLPGLGTVNFDMSLEATWEVEPVDGDTFRLLETGTLTIAAPLLGLDPQSETMEETANTFTIIDGDTLRDEETGAVSRRSPE